MNTRTSFVRRLANRLALGLSKISAEEKRDWARGMAAEVEAIEGDWAAVSFAVGCWVAILRGQSLAAMCRQALAALLLGWAGVKIYLAIWTLQYAGITADAALPDWIGQAAILAGIGYCCAGLGLGLGRYRLMASGFAAALLVNGALYSGAMFGQSGSEFWVMAIAIEDYIIWTNALMGLAIIWCLHNRREGVAR
ncbi:MAG: hypothetical protein ABJG15_06005 [Hyphomonadaceae bacterium]